MTNRWKDQTIFYDPEGPPGNCMQAAVASLLNIPLDSVPHFAESGDAVTCWDLFDEFLEGLGFHVFQRSGSYVPNMLYLASGQSDRGVSHMVVMKGQDLIWDPHPSRTGIHSVQRVFTLIPLDPSMLVVPS